MENKIYSDPQSNLDKGNITEARLLLLKKQDLRNIYKICLKAEISSKK